MKKSTKLISLLLALLLLATLFGLAACKDEPPAEEPQVSESLELKTRVADTALYPDLYKYRDYANEVYIDPVTRADAADQGLFWCDWDYQTNRIVRKRADTEEGAALVDTSKPSIVLVHGVLLDGGHTGPDDYYIGASYADPSLYGIVGMINMVKVWLENGWNVANFNYHRFADEKSGIEAFFSPGYVESKIWALNGAVGMRFRDKDGIFSQTNLFDFTVAELFIADYIRAVNLLPDTFGDSEIRIAGHSMGGEVVTAFTFLATEMYDVGQLPERAIPDRLTLLDAYFSSVVPTMFNPNLIINWSGKQIVNKAVGATMIECLKDIVANGIAVEYYTEPGSSLAVSSGKYHPTLRELSAYIVVYLKYVGPNEAHNGVREWYMMSVFADEPLVRGTDERAVSAVTTTARLLELMGTYYYQVGGYGTQLVADDIFTKQ